MCGSCVFTCLGAGACSAETDELFELLQIWYSYIYLNTFRCRQLAAVIEKKRCVGNEHIEPILMIGSPELATFGWHCR